MDSLEFRRCVDAAREAEARGQVADSMDVRRALMTRVHAGEISLRDAQAELSRIQRGARDRGQWTRSEFFS